MRQILVTLFSLSLLAGAANLWAHKEKHDPIINVSATDPAMEAAKRAGRSSLPEFYRHYVSPAADESMFAVKFDLIPGPETEFIWASVKSYDGKTIIGELANAPVAEGFTLGQRVTIAAADVIDWQYQKGQRMMGHYTTRVLMDKMTAAEAEEYRTALGW